jgi:hypothetical protein
MVVDILKLDHRELTRYTFQIDTLTLKGAMLLHSTCMLCAHFVHCISADQVQSMYSQ